MKCFISFVCRAKATDKMRSKNICLSIISFILVINTVTCKKEEETDHELIEIDKISYSLLERPPDTSPLVQNARASLLMHLDVRTLSQQLKRVGSFIRIAYNGLAMHPILQGEVTNLGIRITGLADKSAVTLMDFGLASGRVLGALESTYWYIYNDKEKFAMGSFASIGKIAGYMANEATKLHNSYEEEVKNVGELIRAVSYAQDSEEKKKINLTEMQNDFESRIKRAQKITEEALGAYKKYEGLFHDARRQEKKAINAQSDPLRKLANAFTSQFGFGEVFDAKAYKNAEEAYGAEKYKYLEKMESFRKIKDEALADLAEFTNRIINSKNDKELADVTINALLKTLGGLKVVSIAMLNAATYWNQIQKHLNDLKEKGTIIADDFDRIMEETNKEERRTLWQSRPFKSKAMELYGEWVAIGSVCYETVRELRGAQYHLREVVLEHRSRQESLDIVRKLAVDFQKEISLEKEMLEAKHDEL